MRGYMFRVICLVVLLSQNHDAQSSEEVFYVGVHERTFYREKIGPQRWAGVDIALIKAIFDQTGFKYEFIEYPWKRSLKNLENGTIDLVLSAAKFPQREQYAWFTEEVFRPGHNVLFIAKNKSDKFASFDSLSKMLDSELKIGAVRGVSYSDEFEQLRGNPKFDANLVILEKSKRLPRMILNGRIDGYLESEFGGQFFINQDITLQEQIIMHSYVTTEQEAQTFLMFSKTSVTAKQVTEFDKAILEIKRNGTYDNVLMMYGLKSNLNKPSFASN